MKNKIKECIDDNGNIIYRKNRRGQEYWWEYDEYSNLTYYKDTKGNEKIIENNTLYCKTKTLEAWVELGEIHVKYNEGYEFWKYYEDYVMNLTHYKDNNGYESWSTYDENNNLIYYKNNKNCEWDKNNKYSLYATVQIIKEIRCIDEIQTIKNIILYLSCIIIFFIIADIIIIRIFLSILFIHTLALYSVYDSNNQKIKS